VLNGKCELLTPGGECRVERKAYDDIVSELKEQYSLKGLADEILAERVAMYLIRVARAEVYEANMGVSSSSVAWGKYIADLDKMLRVFLRELVLTRASQKTMRKNDVLTDVDDLLSAVVRKGRAKPRVFRRRSPANLLVKDWKVEKHRLSAMRR
jgi:hypothetical protein